ncbi:MAG TPA: hypothetical protein ACHBYY_01700 [Arsenophonus nasoniae]
MSATWRVQTTRQTSLFIHHVQENVGASIRNNLKPQITINSARPRPNLNSSLSQRAGIFKHNYQQRAVSNPPKSRASIEKD